MIDFTPDQISLAQKIIGIPSLIILYIISHLILLAIGLMSSNSYKKFFMIFALSAILSGIVLLLLIFIPGISIFFYNLFSK